MSPNKILIPVIILLIVGAYLFGRNTTIKDSKIIPTPEKKINYLQDIDTKIIDLNSPDFFGKNENQKEIDLSVSQKDSLIKFLKDTEEQRDIKFTDNCNAENSDIKTLEVDLTGTGDKNYIVMPNKLCGLSMRGASGNGDIFVLKKSGDAWENIGDLRGNGFAIAKHKTNGYFDMLTNWHNSATSGTQTLFKWQTINNGVGSAEYTEVFSKNYD